VGRAAAVQSPRVRTVLGAVAGAAAPVRWDGDEDEEAWRAHGELWETEVVSKLDALIAPWTLSLDKEAADEFVARIAQYVARRLVGSLLKKLVSPAGAVQLDRDVRRLANVLHARGGPSARDECAPALLAAQMLACASAREAEDVLAAATERARRRTAAPPLARDDARKLIARKTVWEE
jgi:hypothetical protein